jgi:hypothetical protein
MFLVHLKEKHTNAGTYYYKVTELSNQYFIASSLSNNSTGGGFKAAVHRDGFGWK